MRSLSSYPISLELQVCQCNQQHPGLEHSHLWRFWGDGVEYLGQSPHLREYRTGSGHIDAEGVCPGWEIYGSRCVYFEHEKHHGPETLRQPGMLGAKYKTSWDPGTSWEYQPLQLSVRKRRHRVSDPLLSPGVLHKLNGAQGNFSCWANSMLSPRYRQGFHLLASHPFASIPVVFPPLFGAHLWWQENSGLEMAD